MDMEAQDLRKSSKDGVLNACGELCEKKILRKEENTRWWNVKDKDAIARKKEAYKTLRKNRSHNNLENY